VGVANSGGPAIVNVCDRTDTSDMTDIKVIIPVGAVQSIEVGAYFKDGIAVDTTGDAEMTFVIS